MPPGLNTGAGAKAKTVAIPSTEGKRTAHAGTAIHLHGCCEVTPGVLPEKKDAQTLRIKLTNSYRLRKAKKKSASHAR